MRKTNYNEIEKLTFRLNYIEDENTKLKELLEQNGNDLKDKNIKMKILKEKEDIIQNN